MAGITLEIIWNTLGMLRLTGLERGFSASVFVSNITEGELIFVKFSGYVEHDSRNNWLKCFISVSTVSHSSN